MPQQERAAMIDDDGFSTIDIDEDDAGPLWS
jgi:hypothetical protein